MSALNRPGVIGHSRLIERLSEISYDIEDLIDKDYRRILIVTHYDADGLAAGGIVFKSLSGLGAPIHVKIIEHSEREAIRALEASFDIAILLDLGAGMVESLARHCESGSRRIFILDHHKPEKQIDEAPRGISLVSPYEFNVKGDVEVSASTLSYLFSLGMGHEDEVLLASSLIGALGDGQDVGPRGELVGVNALIAKKAEEAGILKCEEALRIPGIWSKTLVRCLDESINPFIRGMLGIEASKLIGEISTASRRPEEIRYEDLNGESRRKLLKVLIKAMLNRGIPPKALDRLWGITLVLTKDLYGIPVRDLALYSLITDLCGRIGEGALGIGLCAGIGSCAIKARHLFQRNAVRILNVLSGVVGGDPELIKEHRKLFLVKCPPGYGRLCGMVASAIASSPITDPNKVIIVYSEEEEAKASIRLHMLYGGTLDLGEVARKSARTAGGEGGGHARAAGARVPRTSFELFIRNMEKFLPEVVGHED